MNSSRGWSNGAFGVSWNLKQYRQVAGSYAATTAGATARFDA